MKNNSDAPALGAPAAGSRDRSSTAVAPASVRGVHPTTTVVCRCASHVLAQTDAERTWRPRPRAQGECNVPSQGQLGSKIGRKSASSADKTPGGRTLHQPCQAERAVVDIPAAPGCGRQAVGRGRAALKAGAIAHRAPTLARPRRRWTIQDVVAAGAAQLVDREIGGGQHPAGATIVPIKE